MSQIHTLDFSAFYQALFGGTNGGRIKRQGPRNQPTRVNRLLFGEMPGDKDKNFVPITKEAANGLIQGKINLTEGHLPKPGSVEQEGDWYTRFLPIFTAHIRSMWSELPDLRHSVQLLQPMMQAAGISVDIPDVADKEETCLFLGKALTVAVINSRDMKDRRKRATTALEAGVQDWETAVMLPVRRGSQTLKSPATHTLFSVKPTGFSVFYGREQQVQELRDAFALQNVVFLHGMGGIGKTALACNYWRTFRKDYSTVVFAQCESSLAALLADDSVFRFSGLCRREKGDGTLQTDEEYAREKLRLLRETQDESTLIILDNYDVEDTELFEELVRSARFHLLVTTQLEPEVGDFCPVELHHIGDDDRLKDLFLKYAGTVMLRREDPGFNRLFEVTERHTLTLEVAAKHMADTGMTSLDELADLLENDPYVRLSSPGGKDRYQKLRALLRITRLNEQEVAFLRCLALVPPAGIDLDIFRDWCGTCFPALNRLARLSLIKQDPESRTLSLHSVLRKLILEELAPGYDNCRDFIHRVALVGENLYDRLWRMPYEEKRLRLSCCRQILSRIPEICDETCPIFAGTAFMLSVVGGLSEGLALQSRVYDFRCSRFGRESKPAMLALSEKARIMSSMDNTCEAARCYTEAADWFLVHPEEGDLDTCIAVQACARNWMKDYIHTDCLDSYRKYEAYMMKGFEYMESLIQRPDLPESVKGRLKSRLFMAEISFHERDEEELAYFFKETELALELDMIRYQESCDLLEGESYASLHGLKEASAFLWGKMDYYKGNIQKAVVHLEESRELLIQYFGRREPRLVEVLEILYLCYRDMGDRERAEEALQEALEIAWAIFVPNHSTLLRLEGYAQEME